MEVAVYGTFMALIFVAALLHRLAGRISNPLSDNESRGRSGRPGPSQFLEQQNQVRFQQTHYQGLRQLYLTVFWDLLA